VRAIILAAGRGTRLPRVSRDLPKCLVPVAGVPVRVFDRNALNGLTITTLAGEAVMLKNPNRALYDDIFESAIANAEARVGRCTTGADGRCFAGEAAAGDFLVIVKYTDPATGTVVYQGRPKGPEDFRDTDGDGVGDLPRASIAGYLAWSEAHRTYNPNVLDRLGLRLEPAFRVGYTFRVYRVLARNPSPTADEQFD